MMIEFFGFLTGSLIITAISSSGISNPKPFRWSVSFFIAEIAIASGSLCPAGTVTWAVPVDGYRSIVTTASSVGILRLNPDLPVTSSPPISDLDGANS